MIDLEELNLSMQREKKKKGDMYDTRCLIEEKEIGMI